MLRLTLRPLRRFLACAAAAYFVAGCSGCAAIKAARQPDKKNLGVLHQGTPRAQVIAELGAPTYTKARPDGTVEDVFSFKQGYAKGVKMGRAFAHGAADVATGGLWEVVGVPAEIWADGTDVQVLVTYDQDENVKYRRVFKGQEVFKERPTSIDIQPKATNIASKPHTDSSRRTAQNDTPQDDAPHDDGATEPTHPPDDVTPASL